MGVVSYDSFTMQAWTEERTAMETRITVGRGDAEEERGRGQEKTVLTVSMSNRGNL